MISEKGLCKILKSAYKQGGYSIIPQTLREDGPAGTWRRNTIILNGATWAVRCPTVDLPGKAAVQIVEDAGYLPVEAVNIQKGAPNQLVLEEVAGSRCELLEEQSVGKLRMRRIPVIFRERWQLYQTERGNVFAFDIELLKLIDFKEVEPSAYMTANGHLGMWFCGDSAVYLAPGRFSVSYQREKNGPVGALRRAELHSVADWLKENEGRLQFVIIMQMPGSPEGLPDREV